MAQIGGKKEEDACYMRADKASFKLLIVVRVVSSSANYVLFRVHNS